MADEDLEPWAPLGPDPPGCLPRASPAAKPLVMIGWGFGNMDMTLYTYRAFESLLHAYTGGKFRFITVGGSVRLGVFLTWRETLGRFPPVAIASCRKRGCVFLVGVRYGVDGYGGERYEGCWGGAFEGGEGAQEAFR